LITPEVEGETHEMNEKVQAFKIQEAHRTSKGIATRILIEKEQSPQCQVEMAEVTDHFRETWSRPLKHVIESEEGPNFHLEPKLQKKTKKIEKNRRNYV
jgi:hypothetical protein